MFSSVELKNYKFFKNTTVSFKNKKGSVKPMILIYGDNGSGKTSFISSFTFLRKSLLSLSNNYLMLEYLQQKKVDRIDARVFSGSPMFDIRDEARKSRYYLAEGNLVLKFGITLNKRDYYYELGFDEESNLVSEKLYRETASQVFDMFTVTPEGIDFGRGSFDHHQSAILSEKFESYWGTYTLLSIIISEIQQNSRYFIRDEIHKSLRSIIVFLLDMHVSCHETGYEHQDFLNMLHRVEVDVEEGVTNLSTKHVLELGEPLAKSYLHWFNPSIIDAYYKFDIEGDLVRYILHIKKKTDDGIIDIPYNRESRGTQNFLSLLRGIVDAGMGHEFIMDGIDNGLHEFAVADLFEKGFLHLKNQNIFTLHSTLVMSFADPGSIYIASEDDGNYHIICIQDITTTQENHNNRARYEKGVFGRKYRLVRTQVPELVGDFIQGSESVLQKKSSAVLKRD